MGEIRWERECVEGLKECCLSLSSNWPLEASRSLSFLYRCQMLKQLLGNEQILSEIFERDYSKGEFVLGWIEKSFRKAPFFWKYLTDEN